MPGGSKIAEPASVHGDRAPILQLSFGPVFQDQRGFRQGREQPVLLGSGSNGSLQFSRARFANLSRKGKSIFSLPGEQGRGCGIDPTPVTTGQIVSPSVIVMSQGELLRRDVRISFFLFPAFFVNAREKAQGLFIRVIFLL